MHILRPFFFHSPKKSLLCFAMLFFNSLKNSRRGPPWSRASSSNPPSSDTNVTFSSLHLPTKLGRLQIWRTWGHILPDRITIICLAFPVTTFSACAAKTVWIFSSLQNLIFHTVIYNTALIFCRIRNRRFSKFILSWANWGAFIPMQIWGGHEKCSEIS